MAIAHSFVHPIVLCGGSGTRLWPLSRQSFPKQFTPLIDNKSLLLLTLERLKKINPKIMCVGAEEHRFYISQDLGRLNLHAAMLLEPFARNTAAAMALAALQFNPDDLLLFCPSDHHIPDHDAFHHMVQKAATAASNNQLVVFGVMPSLPSTAYGYIQKGIAKNDSSFEVVRFIEKPNQQNAEKLLLQGDALWNAGIFLVKQKILLEALMQHAPDILESCLDAHQKSITEAFESHQFVRPDGKAFEACRSQSIDYAVIEKMDNIAVCNFLGAWSDVGSWNAVAQLTPSDQDGNRVTGNAITYLSNDTYVHAQERLVVALGTSDLLIVDTPDAVLVASNKNAEDVKLLVEHLVLNNLTQATAHRKVARPWGWYDEVDWGDSFKVKRIGVNPMASLSLQKHHHRAEHWVVVKGVAEITNGDDVFVLNENQSTYIPKGEVHRLRNPSDKALEIIEIQTGSYLGEDDIVRLEDNYGRTQ